MVGLDQVDNVLDINKRFTESQITGLVADLSSKQPLLTANSIPISYVSGLQSTLNSLQPAVGNNSLTIANTSGLQAALDSKVSTTSLNKASVGLDKVDNIADVNKVFTESQITGLVADLALKHHNLLLTQNWKLMLKLHCYSQQVR